MRYGTHHRDRGATLVLVLVILALGTLLASRQMLQSTVTRLASAGNQLSDREPVDRRRRRHPMGRPQCRGDDLH